MSTKKVSFDISALVYEQNNCKNVTETVLYSTVTDRRILDNARINIT